MGSGEIVDLETDPEEARRRRRGRLLRYGLPLAAIALIVAGLIGSALYTRAINRADVLALSESFVDALSERILAEVAVYLGPATTAAVGMAAAAPGEPLSEVARAGFERVAQEHLAYHPQFASIYVGTPDGAFLMVRRNAQGGFDSKVVEPGAGGPRSTWIRRGAGGEVLAVEPDPQDRFDPRTRGWYRDALAQRGVSWTEVYVFFSDRVPGITASYAARAGDGTAYAVVGVDISLASLSRLLADLQARARGRLLIVGGDGRIVAYQDPDAVMVEEDGRLRPRTIRELGVPEVAEAFDRLRVEGESRGLVTIDGQRYLFGAASLREAVMRDWWLMMLAPEDAYVGFVTANSRRGLLASSGIVALAVVLGGFLAYQGFAAERNARALRAGAERLAAQRRILDHLAGLSGLSDPADETDLREATEILAAAHGARRVSFWRFRSRGGRRDLVCLDAFDPESGGHTEGAVIRADRGEPAVDAMAAGETVEMAAEPAQASESGLHLSYLRAVGTRRALSVPVALAGRAWGAIWIEDAGWGAAAAGDHSLTRSVANLLAPRLRRLAETEAAARPDDGQAEARRIAALASQPGLPPAARLRTASLIELRGKIGDTAGAAASAATVHAGITVLVVKLLDDQALAGAAPDGGDETLMRGVMRSIEEAATTQGVPYVKALADQVVIAAGFRDDPAGAAERIIELALAVRDRCTAMFLAAGQAPQFAIGVDTGTVYGAAVGNGGGTYNLWGETVRVAAALAATAEPGSIQVSEAAYELLRETCAFRPRGGFYLGSLGEISTLTLKGRL